MDKKRTPTMVILAIFFLFAPVVMFSCTPTGGETGVSFEDSNLESAVREAIDKPSGKIELTELEGLTLLDARFLEIKNLEGIQTCHNLRTLWLSNNKISDISPLASLNNLHTLYLSGNQIDDLSPLKTLVNLQNLNLVSNQIDDISPLASHINLVFLDLSLNNVNDLSPIASLIEIKALDLWNNKIDDISPLTELINLEWLQLSDNSITDIEPLVDNNGLSGTVYLRRNPLNGTSRENYLPTLLGRGLKVLW